MARDGLEFVFFDVGATLVERVADPATRVEAALRGTRAGRVAPPAALAQAMRAMDTVYQAELDDCRTLEAEAAFWRRVVQAGLHALAGASPEASDLDAAAAVLADYDGIYRVRSGMRDVLATVRGAGLRVGIISNWPPSLPRFLRHHDLGPFEVVAGSGALGVTKPDPAIFRWALTQAGVPAARAAHVGDDHDRDYLPARALGMHAVWLAPGTTADDVTRALGLPPGPRA